MADNSDGGKLEDPAVTNFRQYLKIKTVDPGADYESAVEFLKAMASGIGLPYSVTWTARKTPVLVVTWEGTHPYLPSVLLNSHMDVVPVFSECWKYDPFEAYKDDQGNIYGRGAQDMKCVGIQYLEALRRLKANGRRCLRTFHVSFMPEEEIDGVNGMLKFVEMEDFEKLNVGFALDEGLANPDEAFKAYYGERSMTAVCVTCPGSSGHSSQFVENTAGEKMRRVINSFLSFRDREERRLEEDPNLTLGDVTTCNFTMAEGGATHSSRVLPADMKAVFDIRVTPTLSLESLEEEIQQWCREGGDGVTYQIRQKPAEQVLTSTSLDDAWFGAFAGACERLGIKTQLEIFPAGTDSRHLRKKGLPALGFSPMNNTPILLHDHDEFLNEDVFLRGIEIYCEILTALGDVPASTDSRFKE